MNNEVVIRLIFFVGIFTLVVISERMSPRRSMTTSKKVRWISNLGITFLNPLVVHLVFPIWSSIFSMLCSMPFPFCGGCT